MQISNLLGQYHQATAAGAEKVTGTKGVENLVSSLKSLTKGNIFEGTISSMKNGKVTLALSNGTLINARMDGKVSLSVGQSMFFQVKSNDGTQIAIRPFVVDGNGVNFTLMQALGAAGLPTESNYLSMVNKMMEEQMPIDRNSLQHMARLVNAHSDIDVQTLVQLHKLGIAITPENAAQFENYLGDRQAITTAIDSLIDELPMAMQGADLPEDALRQMNAKVLSVVTEGLVYTPGADAASGQPQNASPNLLMEAMNRLVHQIADGTPTVDGEPMAQTAANSSQGENGSNPVMTTDERSQMQQLSGTQLPEEGLLEEKPFLDTEAKSVIEQAFAAPKEHTVAAVLNQNQYDKLNEMLGKLVWQDSLNYTPDKDTAALLHDIGQVLESNLPIDKDSLQALLSSKEFKSIIKDVLKQQWTLRPEELTGSDKINRLYEKLDGQMNRMADILRTTGQQSSNFTQMAADIRSNVDFMNQINQAYTYIQVPLKMSGQSASGQLYVYTNKKALAEGDKALTAFLHLDMDHLGATDVSVSMLGKEVSTNFYLENDAAYDLIQQNLAFLEERLQKKGYNCKISVTNETKHVNFVEDFLKKDQPSAGQLHRYSFDMRA